MSEVQIKGKQARAASYELSGVTTDEKNKALELIAEQLIIDQQKILEANAKDLELGKENKFPEAVLDRIMLNEERINDMSHAIKLLMELKDPIGEVIESIEKDNGLIVQKKRVPIGVIGMIYENRPNVTIDAATLSLKTGNAMILRGSSSAINSNLALMQTIQTALEKSALPVDAIQLIEDTRREVAQELFTLNEYLDVLISKSGEKLIQIIIHESTV